jgi:hypothetical protein
MRKTNIKKKITKKFLKNYNIQPLNRLSFIIRKNNFNFEKKFYSSQNKLQCSMSYSFSVPNRRLNYSRFFLNTATDKLGFGGYQKK